MKERKNRRMEQWKNRSFCRTEVAIEIDVAIDVAVGLNDFMSRCRRHLVVLLFSEKSFLYLLMPKLLICIA